MIRHFFIDKATTIIKDSYINTGANPVLSLSCGDNNMIMRGIVSFDLEKVNQWIKENTLDKQYLKFILHLTNKNSLDIIQQPENKISKVTNPFDLEFFTIDKMFDQGRGYDYDNYGNYFEQNSVTVFGANWYNARTDVKWETEGAYTPETSIGTQHFNNGTENIRFDVTNAVLDTEKEFYGIGIKFLKEENTEDKTIEFISNSSNLFFKPYIEVIYAKNVIDDRYNFDPSKENKLYLYVNDGEQYVNLDNIPSCSLGDVTQVKTGVYEVTVPKDTFTSEYNNTIQYDVWDNLSINGNQLDDEEGEIFVLSPRIDRINTFIDNDREKPYTHGLNTSETITGKDKRTIFVDIVKKYGSEVKHTKVTLEYRIYVKYCNKEYTVFDFTPVEKELFNNYFVIYGEDLILGKYFVDIKVKTGLEEHIYKDVLHFNVKNENNQ